jgi:hypothetical protein
VFMGFHAFGAALRVGLRFAKPRNDKGRHPCPSIL